MTISGAELPSKAEEGAESESLLENLKLKIETLEETIEELDQELEEMKDTLDETRTGERKVLFSGHIRTGYTSWDRDGSSFHAILRFHPYWKIFDDAICKADTQFALIENRTDTFLFFANCTFIVTELMNIKVGKFLTPFGFFQEEIHVEWMNKLPNEPLVIGDDLFDGGFELVPTSTLGVQFRGKIPFPNWGLLYAVYVSNGPRLIDDSKITDKHDERSLIQTNGDLDENKLHVIANTTDLTDHRLVGSLKFDNYRDNNDDKAFGGRIAFQFPRSDIFEIGYSLLTAVVGDEGSEYEDVKARIQGFDFSYMDVIESVGKVEFRTEFVHSEVDEVDYGHGSYKNIRRGGYYQFAFRPLGAKNRHVSRMELAMRYDKIEMPEGAPLFDQERTIVGLNYWPWPAFVLKSAYQVATREKEPNQNTFFLQLALGF